ncbi:Zinc/iron permease [Lipomyces oligophaga]|uniref:Zinc/iron permease n=1 Tax=Lipomyces oligophaga TaxID=45792 RepID=UPI0034CF341A
MSTYISEFLPHLVALAVRDDSDSDATPECATSNDYNGRIGVRVSSIFVIMFSSTLGALFPVLIKQSRVTVPEMFYFIAKFFGSGVIIATAFVHLLEPAMDALGDECLGGGWGDYPYAIAFCLISIFILFFIEVMTYRLADFSSFSGAPVASDDEDDDATANGQSHSHSASAAVKTIPSPAEDTNTNDKHFSHRNDHIDSDTGVEVPNAIRLPDSEKNDSEFSNKDLEQQSVPVSESLSAQLAAIFILEFGIIFHSVFVGLSLAIAGDEFNVLYVVLVFHQGFEGLGLGSRLASTPWAPNRKWVPIVMGIAYGLTTPVAIAIGLGVRKSYNDASRKALISNGIFDSISSGILIYTGLVELMAHEFLFSSQMNKAPMSRVLLAFFIMCLGAGLMALLGRWA